jgi:hydrogenase expression/formation protein HypE
MSDPSKYRFSVEQPAPDMGIESISLAHGSGGKLTNRLLDNGVFDVFRSPKLQKRNDGAILEMKSPIAFSTDSFVISPIFFPGGDIGELAINGTVNDVAMTGGIPQFLSLSFIIEEGFLWKDLWEILLSIQHAAKKAGVEIVTGDTKVVEKGKGDQIFINTTGVGAMHPKAVLGTERISDGDVILVSGHVASHGMAILSKREGLEFESDIISDTTNLNELTTALLDQFGDSIKLFRDPTRGGIATVLNEIAIQSRLGILITENYPILPQVKSACEIFGLDPLYVANEGIMLVILKKEIAQEALQLLQSAENGAFGAVLGEITAENPGKVLSKGALGGHRVVTMPIAEQLPRIC